MNPILSQSIPVITASSAAVYKELGKTSTDVFYTTNRHFLVDEGGTEFYPLKAKVKTLEETSKKLDEAIKGSAMHKVCSFLKSALAVAVIATGVIGCLVFPAIFPVFIFIPLVILIILGVVYASEDGGLCDCPADSIGFGAAAFAIGAPFIPIYKTLRKIPNYQNEKNSLKNEIDEKLPKIKNYFIENYDSLKRAIAEKVERAEKTEEQLKLVPMQTESGLKEIREKKRVYEAALDQLERAYLFYKEIKL